jgi:hypothetical protein
VAFKQVATRDSFCFLYFFFAAAVNLKAKASANLIIDVKGMAVSPGFINMLSQAGQPVLYSGSGEYPSTWFFTGLLT